MRAIMKISSVSTPSKPVSFNRSKKVQLSAINAYSGEITGGVFIYFNPEHEGRSVSVSMTQEKFVDVVKEAISDANTDRRRAFKRALLNMLAQVDPDEGEEL